MERTIKTGKWNEREREYERKTNKDEAKDRKTKAERTARRKASSLPSCFV